MRCCCADLKIGLGLPPVKESPIPTKKKYNYNEKNSKALWEVNNPAEKETYE